MSDGGLVVVCGDRGLGGMEAYLLSGERCDPVVALTRSPGTDEPVLGYAQVRALGRRRRNMCPMFDNDVKVNTESRASFALPEGTIACRGSRGGPG